MASFRTLAVDDDPALLDILPDIFRLRLPGVTVDTVADPIRALQQLEMHDYGVILTDFRMPHMNGLSFLRHLQTIRPQSEVIFTTGIPDWNLAEEALRIGAFDFLPKPFDRGEVVRAVSLALEAHRLAECVARQQQLLSRLQQRLNILRSRYGSTDSTSVSGACTKGFTRPLVQWSIERLSRTIDVGERLQSVLLAQLNTKQTLLSTARAGAQERAIGRLRREWVART